MLFLFAAVLQVDVLVLIPAVIYAFTIVSTTTATIFLIWCIIVGLIDNVLKPLLLGRGASVPTAVIFLGAIGGFIGMGGDRPVRRGDPVICGLQTYSCLA